jgi:hypothetical protein
MDYLIDTYQRNEDNTLRFILGKSGTKPLCVMGLNPSTADDCKPDRTLTKIMGFAERNEFDGFMMLNLYPQRTPYPEDLSSQCIYAYHNENMERIKNFVRARKQLHILAAWGATIEIRDYLVDCLLDITKIFTHVPVYWYQIGEQTQKGHPRHPSRAAYSKGLQPFDIEEYIIKQSP